MKGSAIKKNKNSKMTHKTTTDAIELIESDHRRIEALFADYREMASGCAPAAQRKLLAEEICLALAIHLRLEQELFCPAVRDAFDDADLADESESDHERLRDMLAQVFATRADYPLFDARLAVLDNYVASHIGHGREQLYPALRRAPVDLLALGRRIAVRKDELHAVADALREDALAAALTT